MARVEERIAADQEGISANAVAAGLAADIVASLALPLVAGIVFGDSSVASGNMREFIGGLASTALGGYVAAHVAGRAGVKHGVMVGVAAMLLGLVLMSLGERPPLTYIFGVVVLTVPAAALGAWIHERQTAV